MQIYNTEQIRNIVLVGHTGEGKTTLAEAMLYNAKVTDRLGSVDDGTTVMDFDEEEIKRKISISLSVSYIPWKNYKFNIIDTPGFFDFSGEVAAAMHVAGAAVLVASACGQVTVGTERAIELLEERGLPGILFINQVEKENYDFNKTLDALITAYPKKMAVIQMPIIDGGKMSGYVNIIEDKAYDLAGGEIPIPPELKAQADSYFEKITEIAAESDDALMEKYFEGTPLTMEEITKGIKKRQLDDGIMLVMGGSALHNKGIESLMDEIVHCMRSPKEVPPQIATDPNGIEHEIAMDPALPFSALVFKSIADPFVGKLSIFKVLSGVLHAGDTVMNMTAEKQEKIGTLYVLRGKKQESVDRLEAGDIGAVAKLLYTNTSDTLCDAAHKLKFKPIRFPKPAISLAVESAVQGEEEKVMIGLHKLQEEDPTLIVEKHPETGETLLAGIGETQLDCVCKKLKGKFKIEVKLENPVIPYRETIRKKVEEQGKYKKQSGGHGQYGDVHIRFEPAPGETFVFGDEIVGGSVPKQYIPAVEKGLRECIAKGAFGYPMTEIKCTLYFGSYHDVDSSEMAFKMAASLAYKKMLEDAKPVLLEPIETVRIVVPEQYLGEILGDVNKRRGRILGMETEAGKQVIQAEIPLSELTKYATDLRSMTQGRGEFTMEFARYEEAPAAIAEKVARSS